MEAIWYLDAFGTPIGPMTVKEMIERLSFCTDPGEMRAWTNGMASWELARDTDLKFYMPIDWLRQEPRKTNAVPVAEFRKAIRRSTIFIDDGSIAKKKSKSFITWGIALLIIPYIGWILGILMIITGLSVRKSKFFTSNCPHCSADLYVGEKAKSSFQKCVGCGHALEWRPDGLVDLS